MIHVSTIALSAGLAIAALVHGTVSTQAAPDGRKYKMLTAPLVLGTVRHASSHHARGLGLSARPRTQRIGSLLLPAVQKVRDSAGGGGGGGSGSKPKGPEDCMSCAD
jgi:hypothetical protein